MAIDWKHSAQRRLVILLAGAAAIILTLGISLRSPEEAVGPPASETETVQLQERIVRSALRQPTEFLQRLALRQSVSLAYSPDLDSTVVVLDQEGWAVASAARVPAHRETILRRQDGTALQARMEAADPLHGVYLLRIPGGEAIPPIAPDEDVRRLKAGEQLLVVGLDSQVRLSLVSGQLSRPLRTDDPILPFSGTLPEHSLGSVFLTLDESAVGLRVRERGGLRARSWNFVASIIAQLRRNGMHPHPYLGVRVHDLSELERQELGLPPGVVVSGVAAHSPAALRGVRPGDLLLRMNEVPVATANDFRAMVNRLPVGSLALLTLWRDGPEHSVEVQVETVEVMRRRAAGAKLLAGWGTYLVPAEDSLQVKEVEPWSQGARAGLEPGDLLRRVDGRSFSSVSALERHLQGRGSPAVAEIVRAGELRLLRLPPLGAR